LQYVGCLHHDEDDGDDDDDGAGVRRVWDTLESGPWAVLSFSRMSVMLTTFKRSSFRI